MSHLESVVGHVTDVDDVVRGITEHLSKPEGVKTHTATLVLFLNEKTGVSDSIIPRFHLVLRVHNKQFVAL